MLNRLKLAALCVFCLGIPVALWEWYRILPGSMVEQPKVTYAELVTIMLTGLTVAVALFAGIVGVLGVWGFSNIKDEASNAARNAVDAGIKIAMDRHHETLGATMKEGVRPFVREILHEMQLELSSPLYATAFPQSAEGDGEAASKRIADELPGENNEAR